MLIEESYNKSENILCFKIHGEIDISTSTELKETLSRSIEFNCPNILLDCENLKYIDSTGLGVMVSTLKKSKEFGGTITIINLKPYLKKIFKITALDKIFNLEVNSDE